MERYSIENFILDENELAEHYKEKGNKRGYKGKLKLVEYLKELKTYKDAEEQGLLLRLPCPIRSEVWKIVKQRDNFSDEPYRIATCVNFRLDMLSEIGKTVFLTKEEAEQALKQMGE